MSAAGRRMFACQRQQNQSSELTVGVLVTETLVRFLALSLDMATSAWSALSSASSTSFWALRYLARLTAASSSCYSRNTTPSHVHVDASNGKRKVVPESQTAALISVSVVLSQTPVYTARPCRAFCLAAPKLSLYSLQLPMEGYKVELTLLTVMDAFIYNNINMNGYQTVTQPLSEMQWKSNVVLEVTASVRYKLFH